MRRSFVPVAVSVLLLVGCSPAQYKVNPPVAKEVTESEQKGYMRIIGDLRWDELTSKGEWMDRFPQCLTDLKWSYSGGIFDGGGNYIYQLKKKEEWEVTNKFPIFVRTERNKLSVPKITDPKIGSRYDGGEAGALGSTGGEYERRTCEKYLVGGIKITPYHVSFSENTGTEAKTMASDVKFAFFDDSKSRAFKSAIAQKYALTTSGYCSKFTCWDLGDVDKAGAITARPTPYTVSILDDVKVDKSDI